MRKKIQYETVSDVGRSLDGAPIAGFPAATTAEDPYPLYVLAELTGSNAFVGAQEAKSALAAESLINRSGGINGRQIKVIVEDNQSNPQVAVQLMNDAVAKHAAAVVGNGIVSTCNAASGLIKDDGPVLCWSSGVHPKPGSIRHAGRAVEILTDIPRHAPTTRRRR